MYCMTWAACCVAAATFTRAVSADVAVTIGAEGYDDFFKRCKLDIGMRRSDNIAESMIVYRIAAGDKGALMCTKEDYSSGCNGELENYTCDDVTDIDVYGAVCLDGNGARTDCGKVTAKKGGGLSAPVRMLPDPPAADTVVFGSLSGYDDLFRSLRDGLHVHERSECAPRGPRTGGGPFGRHGRVQLEFLRTGQLRQQLYRRGRFHLRCRLAHHDYGGQLPRQ